MSFPADTGDAVSATPWNCKWRQGDNGAKCSSDFSSSPGAEAVSLPAGIGRKHTGGTGSGLGIGDPMASAGDWSELVRTGPVSLRAGMTQLQPVCSRECMGPRSPFCFAQEPTHLQFVKKKIFF